MHRGTADGEKARARVARSPTRKTESVWWEQPPIASAHLSLVHCQLGPGVVCLLGLEGDRLPLPPIQPELHQDDTLAPGGWGVVYKHPR
jgi:hypothetical protein